MNLDLTQGGALSPEHARQLDAIADEIRLPYQDMIAALGAAHTADMDWWVTPVASRNIFASDLFLRCCQVLLALRVAVADPARGHIAVDSVAMMRTLQRELAGSDVRVRCTRSRWRIAGRNAALRLYRLAAAAFHCFNRFACSRLWPRRDAAPRGPLVLVDTFIYRDSLDDAGGFRDRHFPGILDSLNEEERAQLYFTPTFYRIRNYPAIFRKLRAARANFLLAEDYLRAADYVAALAHPWRVPAVATESIRLAGIEMGELVREAVALGFAESGSIEGILRYRFARRLREASVKLRLVLEWFENQGLDRGAVTGVRENYPDTPIVGCEGYIVPRHYLCLYPTRQERESSVIPHTIAVTGPALVAGVREFCPELEVEIMPAFRFAGVWRARPDRADRERFTVLAALPLMARESREILACLFDACEISGAARTWSMQIKPHPTMPADALLRDIGRPLPAHCELVSGDLDGLLASADALVSSASSACAQALASGVPVVILGSLGGLTQNPIPPATDRRLWQMCYTVEELVTALERIAGRSAQERARDRALGMALRGEFFAPVTRDSVARLLRLDGRATT